MSVPHPNPDGTTSHSTKPASGQVAGYPPKGEGTNDRCANFAFFAADENTTLALAQRLATLLKPGIVIYLRGDLGAGKTTFVRGVLNALGHTGRVKSPTYTLVESYHAGGLNLLHFDLYRMHDAEEWESAGFRDEFDGRNVFLIEWPEKAQELAPPADLEIVFSILAHGRQIELHANTETGRQCIRLLKE
ncbi:MAG: tRNA (adenosine(37)-N6)-threonylcarbamoyltransferase complex ATPase subunit type 1 TsaE [Gallionellaceae bacterium]|nr:tRNA (adenosine(37)-N6)-threonylcarbamoyltransferase complex ATPase subunit type 1 TsaE [Gallionellaceae bacterium]